MNYFISDLHLGHNNCLAFDNRPFKSIDEQDEVIIKNWNGVVGIDDDVFLLGDISWYDAKKTIEIFNKLNGHIHLIKGNHDGKVLKNRTLQKDFVKSQIIKNFILKIQKLWSCVIIQFLVLEIIIMVVIIYMDMFIQGSKTI